MSSALLTCRFTAGKIVPSQSPSILSYRYHNPDTIGSKYRISIVSVSKFWYWLVSVSVSISKSQHQKVSVSYRYQNFSFKVSDLVSVAYFAERLKILKRFVAKYFTNCPFKLKKSSDSSKRNCLNSFHHHISVSKLVSNLVS